MNPLCNINTSWYNETLSTVESQTHTETYWWQARDRQSQLLEQLPKKFGATFVAISRKFWNFPKKLTCSFKKQELTGYLFWAIFGSQLRKNKYETEILHTLSSPTTFRSTINNCFSQHHRGAKSKLIFRGWTSVHSRITRLSLSSIFRRWRVTSDDSGNIHNHIFKISRGHFGPVPSERPMAYSSTRRVYRRTRYSLGLCALLKKNCHEYLIGLLMLCDTLGSEHINVSKAH